MSIQNVLRRLTATSAGQFPRSASLVMFIGVVVGPLVLFVVGGRNPNTLGQYSLAWSFLASALLLLVSVGGGCWMFRRESDTGKALSISPKYR